MGRPRTILVGALLALGLLASASAAASTTPVIDFEGLAEGQVVHSVASGSGISGDPVSGSVTVFGKSGSPTLWSNTAIIFDATCAGGCTGGDVDLLKPELGNVLVIAENLTDSDGDGLVDDPDDADLPGAWFTFDFSGWGTGKVTVHSFDVLDVEPHTEPQEAGATAELYSGGAGGTLLAAVPIPATGNNGLATVAVNVSGVDFMRITLNGSGAVDNIRLSPDVPPPPPPPLGGEGCTPGFWKTHPSAWGPTGLAPGQTVSSLFSSAAAFPTLAGATLLEGLAFGGGPGAQGGAKILLRAAVAAALNAAHPDVAYPRPLAQVVSDTNAALATGDRDTMLALAAALDNDNNAGCPIDDAAGPATPTVGGPPPHTQLMLNTRRGR